MCAHSKMAKGTAFANRVKRDHYRQQKCNSAEWDRWAATVAAVCGVSDMRRSIWSLGSMMDSGCDVYFAKDRCWLPKITGKNLTWFSAVECSSWQPNLQNRRRETDSIRCHQQGSNEQRRQECRLDLESLTLQQETRWTEMNSQCASEFPRARWYLSWREALCNFETRALSWMLSMVCCSANSGWTAFEGTAARNRRSRVKNWVWLCRARARGGSNFVNIFSQRVRWRIRELNSNICVPRKHSVSIRQKQPWHSWRFSDTIWWCYTQTKNLCLVQLLKIVQNRHVERTSVGHGPRTSHQSQSMIENANQVTNGVCWSRWLTLENLLREKPVKWQHSVGLADPSRCVEFDEVSGEERREKRTFACFWKGSHESVAIRRKSNVRALPWQQTIRIRGGTTESGLARLQWLTSVSFWQRVGSRRRNRCTAWHPRISSWSVSWRKVENFLRTTWQRMWSQRLRRARTKIHLDIGVCVWRSRLWWGLEQHLDAAAVPDGDLIRKHVGCDREGHWLTRKKARVRERSEQELDQLQKWPWSSNKQPTAVMQQEPSPSPFFSPTAPMQEPTQNVQNEQMDSPMEMEAQERREQRKVRLNETMSSEMSKRPVVKAKSARPSMIAPMRERLGSTVLLDPAPSSKDETTTGSLHAIDGIDVVTTLVPEEDVWQFEVTKTCAREIHFQDGEQESVSIVNPVSPRPSPSAKQERVRSSTQKKCGREKKRCKSSMSSKSKWKLSSRRLERRYGQNGWKHERIYTSFGTRRLVSAIEKAVLGRNQGPSVPRDVDGRVAILNLIRVRDPYNVFFWRMQVSRIWRRRNRDTISFFVVTPKDLRRKWKIWSLLENRCGTRDTSQVFATHVEEGPTNTVFRKTHWCRGGAGKQRWRRAVFTWEMASFLPFQVSEQTTLSSWRVKCSG